MNRNGSAPAILTHLMMAAFNTDELPSGFSQFGDDLFPMHMQNDISN